MSARNRQRADSHAEFRTFVRNVIGWVVALVWATVFAAFWVMTP